MDVSPAEGGRVPLNGKAPAPAGRRSPSARPAWNVFGAAGAAEGFGIEDAARSHITDRRRVGER